MAKKISLNSIEQNKKNIKGSTISKKLKIILIVLLSLSIIGNITFGILYEISVNNNRKLKQANKKLLSDNHSLESENEDIHNNLFLLIGDKPVYYIKNKLNMMDENIVFRIEGYGNYYYSYDCVMKKTSGEFTYWAYNKEAAIANGLRAGGCE